MVVDRSRVLFEPELAKYNSNILEELHIEKPFVSTDFIYNLIRRKYGSD